jgi:alpha-1,3-mannosyltransferase
MNESILMTASEFQQIGGHNVVINNLSKEISKLGYSVTIGAFSFKENPSEGIDHLKIKKNPLKKNKWQDKFNLIHNHETKLNYYSLYGKKPFIFHYHGVMGQIQKMNLSISLKLCQRYISKIISVSDSALNDIPKNTKEKIPTLGIYNGVNNNFFNVKEFKDFRKGEQELIFVGNLTTYKNIGFLINAIKKLKVDYPKIHLQVIGGGSNENTLSNKIKSLHLENNIELVGKINSREEIRSRFLSSDVYVSASIFEACPLPPLEAMACGLPILLSKIPAHKELIDKSNGGYCFSLDSEREIVDQFSKILHNKKNYGSYSKSFAKNNDWKIVAKKVVTIYKELF